MTLLENEKVRAGELITSNLINSILEKIKSLESKWPDAIASAPIGSIYHNQGNVGIGTTEPGEKLDVKGAIRLIAPDSNIYGISLQRTDENARLHKWTFWHMNSSYRKNSLELWEYKADSNGITCNGNRNDGAMCDARIAIIEGGDVYVFSDAHKPGGGPWSDTSDIRLKKNVKPLKGALDQLLKLRGVCFEWKEPENHGNLIGKQMGLIADEVEEVFPEWIKIGPDGYKNMSIRGFEALTIEGFREINEANKELKEKNKEFEDRINALEQKIKTH